MSLDATGVTFSYPRRRGVRPAIDRVTFSARAGELVFVLGPNGSGKSTLFKLLLGFLRPDAGRLALDGVDTASLPARALARRVAYVPQAEQVGFDFTAYEVALMGRTPHLDRFAQRPRPADHAAVEDALVTLGIEHLADTGVASMSGGERQLVLLARALCQEAHVLVLDEPTSALDFANQSRVLGRLAALASAGYLLLVSSHNPAHALAHADRFLLLRHGRLIGDTTPGRPHRGRPHRPVRHAGAAPAGQGRSRRPVLRPRPLRHPDFRKASPCPLIAPTPGRCTPA